MEVKNDDNNQLYNGNSFSDETTEINGWINF